MKKRTAAAFFRLFSYFIVTLTVVLLLVHFSSVDVEAPSGDPNTAETAGSSQTETVDPITDQTDTLTSSTVTVTVTDVTGNYADAAPVEEAKATIRARIAALPLAGLSADAFGAGLTDEYFKDPAWAELSRSCLGCGTCTFVCPTCQCYDVQDFDDGQQVRRFRCWDSCMFSDFTMMAHGTNRPTQKERFRQRFMHKLSYFPNNNDGIFGCVGCGRCLQKCPIHMHIVKVAKALKEDSK